MPVRLQRLRNRRAELGRDRRPAARRAPRRIVVDQALVVAARSAGLPGSVSARHLRLSMAAVARRLCAFPGSRVVVGSICASLDGDAPRCYGRAAMRCLYVDLDGTLLGPRRLAACAAPTADSRWTACARCRPAARADVEVVIYSGRTQQSVFEDSRLIGSRSYIFELGCGLVLDGELEWLTDGLVPSAETRLDLRPDRGLGRAGAAARALRRPARVPHALVGRTARSRTCSAATSTSTRSRRVLGRRRHRAGCGWSTTASSAPRRADGRAAA